MFKQFKNHLVGSVPVFGRYIGYGFSPKSSVSDPEPDSGAFWIRIRIRRIRIQGLKKRSKMLPENQNKIISLFTTLYLSIDFFC